MKNLKEKNLVRQAIRTLEEDGRLSAEIVVKAASNPRSPLHKYFEWDDTKAAAAYRLDQARHIIRVVQYDVTVDDAVIQSISYVRDPLRDHKEQGYVSMEQIKEEPENAMVMVLAEVIRVEALLSRAESIAKVLDLAHLVVPVARKVKRLRRKLESIRDQPSAV